MHVITKEKGQQYNANLNTYDGISDQEAAMYQATGDEQYYAIHIKQGP
jgi:hypothetical protein